MGDLAKKAVRCALVRLGHPAVTSADFEDMEQEAAAALWQSQGHGENYAFVCARNAATNWYIGFVWGVHRKDVQPHATPVADAQALPEDEADWHIAPEPESRGGIPPEMHLKVLDIFQNARDVAILQLVLEGYTNEGIAQELGLTPASIKRYRSEIRRKLEEEANGN